MTDRERAFIEALRGLLSQFGVKIDSSEYYDGNDNYAGAVFNFVGCDINLSMDDIQKETP